MQDLYGSAHVYSMNPVIYANDRHNSFVDQMLIYNWLHVRRLTHNLSCNMTHLHIVVGILCNHRDRGRSAKTRHLEEGLQ